MKKLTLLLLTSILAMSMLSLFTACEKPEAKPEPANQIGGDKKEAGKKPLPATCDGKPWNPGQWCISTLASAGFNKPNGIAAATDGNTLYVADTDNNSIKKITIDGETGKVIVSTLVSNGLNNPSGIALVSDALYITDTLNLCIKKIDLTAPYAVTIIANKDITFPIGIAAATNVLYITDSLGGVNLIKKLSLKEDGSLKAIDIIAGSTKGNADNAKGILAKFGDFPQGIVITPDALYVADSGNHRIRKIALSGTNKVSTIARIGFNNPHGIALASDGTLYVADTGNHVIKRLTLQKDGSALKAVTIIAGEDGTAGTDDGIGTAAQFNYPSGIAAAKDKDGNTLLYVADRDNNSIRKLEYKE